MNLDHKEVYHQERNKLNKMSTEALQKLVGELHNEIYLQNNP